MAYSTGVVSANELANQAAGKPCFLGRNAIELSTVAPQWSTVGTWGGSTNSVAADHPTSRLYDRIFDLDTRPTGTASTWYLLFELDDADANDVFDTALLQHSIGDCISAGTVDVVVTIADNNSFSTNAVDIVAAGDWTISPGNPGIYRRRWISLDGGSARYTAVKWVRVAFVGTGTGNWIPQVSEFWLGRRRQIRRAPNTPHDPGPLESRVVDVQHETGGLSRYVLGEEQIRFEASWDLTSDEDDLSTFSNLRADTRGFTKPFAYWLGTDDTIVFVWLLARPSYSRPVVSANHRTFSLSASELTPYLFSEIEANA